MKRGKTALTYRTLGRPCSPTSLSPKTPRFLHTLSPDSRTDPGQPQHFTHSSPQPELQTSSGTNFCLWVPRPVMAPVSTNMETWTPPCGSPRPLHSRPGCPQVLSTLETTSSSSLPASLTQPERGPSLGPAPHSSPRSSPSNLSSSQSHPFSTQLSSDHSA